MICKAIFNLFTLSERTNMHLGESPYEIFYHRTTRFSRSLGHQSLNKAKNWT